VRHHLHAIDEHKHAGLVGLGRRPASTRLLDGRVLIVGGLDTALRIVQVFP
jgi:hypothetical protein